jgi:hypothetical protein
MSFTAEDVGRWVVGGSRQWGAGDTNALELAGSNPGALFLFLDLGRRVEGKKTEGFFWLGRGYPAPAYSRGSSLLIGIAHPTLKNVRWRAIINSIQTSRQLRFCMRTRCFSQAKSRAKPTTRKIDCTEVYGSL